MSDLKRFSIGTLRVDAERKVVYEGEKIVGIPPRAVEILLVLLEHAGEVVSRDEIRERVWGGTYVEEANITRNIGLLRVSLREKLDNADPIETYPKRGYRYVGAVTVLEQADTSPAVVLTEPRDVDEGGSDGTASVSAVVPAAVQPSVIPWKKMLVGTALACVAGASLYFWSKAFAVSQRPSVAVLSLRNISSDESEDWVGEGLRETLSAGLAADGGARLVSADRTQQVQQSFRLDERREIQANDFEAIGKQLGCTYVVTGTFLPAGQELRVDLVLRDVATGAILASFNASTNYARLATAVADANNRFRTVLKLKPSGSIDAYLLHTDDANGGFAAYFQGLRMLRLARLNEARDLLTRAVEAHPSSSLPHSALASAWQAMGYSEQAGKEARLAVATGTALPTEQRLATEANAARINTDWAHAIAAYSQLLKLYPDETDYALALAESYTRQGQPEQAIKILNDVRSKDAATDPRIAMGKAAAAFAKGDWKGELLYAGDQIRLARASGSPFLLSRGLLSEGTAWARLGDRSEAMADYAEAASIAEKSNDQGAMINVLTAWGAEKGYRKDSDSIATLERAVSLARDAGYRAAEVNALAELGCAYTYTEDWPAAKRAFHQSVDLANQLHSPGLGIGALMDLAYVALNEDDLTSAELYARESMQLGQRIHNMDAVSSMYLDLGDVHYARGKIAEAREDYRQSLTVVKATDGGYAIAKTLTHLAVLEQGAGNLAEARRLHEQAKAMRVLLGERLEYQQLAEARLMIAEGKVAEARAAMTALASKSSTARPGAEAWRLVAVCSLEQGDVNAASAAIDKAYALAKDSKDTRTFLIPVSVVKAEIQAARGQHGAATAALERVQSMALAIGDVPLQTSIRLVKEQIEQQAAGPTQRPGAVVRAANRAGVASVTVGSAAFATHSHL